MNRWTIALPLMCCAGLFILHRTQAEEQYTLQYRFEKGNVYRFTDTIAVKSFQGMRGREKNSTSTIRATTRVVATEVRDNGTSVLTVSYDTVSVSVTSAQVDTTLVPNGMIGKRTRVTVSRLGDFTRREVIDTVKLTGIMGTVAERGFIHFHPFPAKPVKMGQKWTATRPDTNQSMGGKIFSTSTLEYVLVAKAEVAGRECLKISYSGKISISGKGSMMGTSFFVEGSGTTSGTLLVDPGSGLALSEESRTDVESTVALAGEQSMTIPSSQSVTTHRILLTR